MHLSKGILGGLFPHLEEETNPPGARDGLDAIGDVEFPIDAGGVGFHSARRDKKLLSDDL